MFWGHGKNCDPPEMSKGGVRGGRGWEGQNEYFSKNSRKSVSIQPRSSFLKFIIIRGSCMKVPGGMRRPASRSRFLLHGSFNVGVD